MKQVELVRQRAAKGMQSEILRFRVWLSGVDGNAAEVEMLRDKRGEALLAMLIEVIMIHLGVDNLLTTSDDGLKPGKNYSQARKAVRGKL
ncbi:MAG: hypothetical protein V4457_06010 [Pseudomonadota bacterium]